jgi:hypothetical protein
VSDDAKAEEYPGAYETLRQLWKLYGDREDAREVVARAFKAWKRENPPPWEADDDSR